MFRARAFLWIAAAVLAPQTGVRGDNCFEQCSYALGSDDPVSITIYEGCLNTCRARSSGQGSAMRYALAISNSNQRVDASHAQTSEAAANQVVTNVSYLA